MEALKLKGRAENGMLTVVVPDSFNNTDLDVIVLHENVGDITINKPLLAVQKTYSLEDGVTDTHRTNIDNDSLEGKKKRLLSIIGSAKDKDVKFDKHDVYEQ